ncbi:hypothetical protein M3Y99_01156100 [Aphelenchoides fujianensis]|nr:hypothetical protein M3Y99_01156100 [Aphelenchoides fujianensis]
MEAEKQEGTSTPETLKFAFNWTVKPGVRHLSSSGDSTILHVFAEEHSEDDEDEGEEEEKPAVLSDGEHADCSLSIYYGPVSCVEMEAAVGLAANGHSADFQAVKEGVEIAVDRGQEVEVAPVRLRIGEVIRISVTLELISSLFRTEAYLNAVSPTPFHSFLTANYRARACSKVWKRRSHQSFKRPRSRSEGQPNCLKIDLERQFNRVMEQQDGEDDQSTGRKSEHLFKKLLCSCCDSCQRRASIIPCADEPEEEETVESADAKTEGEGGNEDESAAFECPADEKAEIHDILANMYFNKIALPQMEVLRGGRSKDFLIDAELNDLPVLKRACERYLCGELNTTSLLLDMLFMACVFQLPILKSMTLSELSERFEELEDVERLLDEEEYQKLDKRIRKVSDRSLQDLVDECRRFREQRIRVQQIN